MINYLLKRIKKIFYFYSSQKSIKKETNLEIKSIGFFSNVASCVINGQKLEVFLRHFSSDYAVFRQIFIEKQYDIVVQKILNSNIEIRNIIDCGANIGFSSLYFSLFLKNINIICIEPDLGNYKILRENLLRNNLSLKLVNAGIWNKDCYLMIDNSFRDRGEWSVSVIESSKPTNLKGVTLNTILFNNKLSCIDLLKIDIEGSESKLFSDQHFINTILPITKVICIEIHEEIISKDSVKNILKSQGFDLSDHGEITLGVNNKII